jgi:hypothetical protein
MKDKIIGCVIAGAMAWATWTTIQLHQIQSDLAVIAVRMETIAVHTDRLNQLEAAVWPRAWRR